jgi:phospholipid transport system substrate-binding protein
MRVIGRRAVVMGLGAGGVMPGATAARAAASEVTAPVEKLYTALLGIMKQGRARPFAERFEAVAPVIDQVFDLPGILQVSVGLRWAALPAGEQAALLAAYRRYTVSTYVANFDNFNGQRFEVLPTPRTVGKDEVVQSRIIPATGASRQLDYAMRQVGGSWRIVDVLFDGSISRLAVQRSDFRSLMAGGGAALLASLQQKTADLQAASQ